MRSVSPSAMPDATPGASAYAKEKRTAEGLVPGVPIAAALERTDQRLQLSVSRLLRLLQTYKHFHSGEYQLPDRGYLSIVLIDALLNGHFLSLPDSVGLLSIVTRVA